MEQPIAGEITTDRYGRSVPKHAHGTENLGEVHCVFRRILQAATELFERIVNPDLLVRRMYLTATHAVRESEAPEKDAFEQLDLFTDYQALDAKKEEEKQNGRKRSAGRSDAGYKEEIREERDPAGDESGGRSYRKRPQ